MKPCPIGKPACEDNCFWNRRWVAESCPSCKYDRVNGDIASISGVRWEIAGIRSLSRDELTHIIEEVLSESKLKELIAGNLAFQEQTPIGQCPTCKVIAEKWGIKPQPFPGNGKPSPVEIAFDEMGQ